jgi:hypothetical protein
LGPIGPAPDGTAPYQAPCPTPCPAPCPEPLVVACPGPKARVYGEFLYLRPSDAGAIDIALPVNSSIVPPPQPPIPMGAVVATSPVYQPGFKVGFGFQLYPQSEWDASYTYYFASASGGVSVDPAGNVALDALVVHPSTAAATDNFTDATGSSTINLQLIDVDYHSIFVECWFQGRWVFGARYAHLGQSFNAEFSNVATTEDVHSHVNFDGGGLRVGLEGEWHSPTTGLLLYANGYASFIAGRFSSNYEQTDNVAGVVVSTSQGYDRIVPIFDLELGVGWMSENQRWKLTAGYTMSAWYNIVSPGQFIQAVQRTDFQNVDDTLRLDGFVVQAEYRW